MLLDALARQAGDAPCLLTVRAGAGGLDAEDWALTLTGMYQAYAGRRGLRWQEIDRADGREDGVRQITVKVTGPGALGLLRGEEGAHRIAHHSRFGSRGKRQTSFAAVEVMPWAAPRERRLDRADIEISAFAGSSKGGQHANRSATNIRVRHLPTGITATSLGRSQTQNTEAAISVLTARVARHQQQEEARRRGEPVDATFGYRVRSYTSTPYQLVSDDRVSYKTRRLQAVLAGDLDDIVLRLLLRDRRLAG